jgi:hypothetical protein
MLLFVLVLLNFDGNYNRQAVAALGMMTDSFN